MVLPFRAHSYDLPATLRSQLVYISIDDIILECYGA